MRASNAIALLATIILLSSCTKESAFFTETTPVVSISVERHHPKKADRADTTVPETTQLQGDTTLALQVVSESIDPNTGIYSITLGSNFDFTNRQPTSNQLLDFTDGQSNHSQVSFPVSGYQVYNKAIDIHFTLGSQNMSGLDLSEIQMIVVEDIIIN